MDVDDKKRIQANYEIIVSDLRVKDIQDHLYSQGVLSEEDLEKISNITLTSQERVRVLLRILKKRGGKSYSVFSESLFADYSHILEALKSTDVDEIQLCEDEVDYNTKMFEFMQKQMELQQQVMINYISQIEEFKKKAAEAEKIQEKYRELDNAMENVGITGDDLKDILKDYTKISVRSMSENNCINNGRGIDFPDLNAWPERDISDRVDEIERICRVLGHDLAYYISNDYDESKPPPNKYAATMRTMSCKVLEKNIAVFRGGIDQLEFSSDKAANGYQALASVANIILEEEHGGVVSWGRIVTLYTFGAWVARFYHKSGNTKLANEIGHFIGFYVGKRLKEWIRQEGGWVSNSTVVKKTYYVNDMWLVNRNLLIWF